MKGFLAAALLGSVYGLGVESDFAEHIAMFGHSYGTIAEFNFRKERFEAADALIKEHNS